VAALQLLGPGAPGSASASPAAARWLPPACARGRPWGTGAAAARLPSTRPGTAACGRGGRSTRALGCQATARVPDHSAERLGRGQSMFGVQRSPVCVQQRGRPRCVGRQVGCQLRDGPADACCYRPCWLHGSLRARVLHGTWLCSHRQAVAAEAAGLHERHAATHARSRAGCHASWERGVCAHLIPTAYCASSAFVAGGGGVAAMVKIEPFDSVPTPPG